MTAIPLHRFHYQPGNSFPFEIGRIETLPPAARAGYPNRHTFYEVLWITTGTGIHHIDFEDYTIQPNTLFIIAPGQVHAWNMLSPLTGYAMLFPSEFFGLDEGSATFLDELSIFRPGEAAPAIWLTGHAAVAIDTLVHRVMGEFMNRQFGQLTALRALMQLMLLEAQRHRMATGDVQTISAAGLLTQRFLRLVDQQYARQHTVRAYATALGVTANYLTDVIATTTGLAAGAQLRHRLTLEAKRRLAHSDEPAATVALQLGFDDPAYFGRFFRRETGQSPISFRTRFREKYQNAQR
jgi:AraC-like DNA-binding protein